MLTGTPPSVGVAGETLDVIVTATDSGGLSVSDTFELAIDSAPVAPVITAHTDGGVTEDRLLCRRYEPDHQWRL